MPSQFLTLICCIAGSLTAAELPEFHRDIQPILSRHCQGCHRPGEIGPMSFMTYAEVRPWAKAIKQSVATKRMPPWFADPHHGTWANDRSMPQAEIERLISWVDHGAPEGKPQENPSSPEFIQGWNIPTPDLVIGMDNPFPVPANSKIDYQYIIIPLDLKEDRWVQMVESRPSDPSVVHHVVVFIRAPESKWLRDVAPQTPVVPGGDSQRHVGGFGNEILHIYTPGNVPDIFRPGQAKLLTAGSDLVLQMHYTSTRKSTEDQTKIGLVWAKEPPRERIVTQAASNVDFSIPPGVGNFPVKGYFKVPNQARLLSFFPHMHLRGKAFEMNLQDGNQATTLIRLPRYDFNWQLTYKLKEPIPLRPGMRLEAIGYFDNSANNPFNPDPKATVKWGEQSWEEMMYGFFDIAIDASFKDTADWYKGKASKDIQRKD